MKRVLKINSVARNKESSSNSGGFPKHSTPLAASEGSDQKKEAGASTP